MKIQTIAILAVAFLAQASFAGDIITAKSLQQPELVTVYGHLSSGVAPQGFDGIQVTGTDGMSYLFEGKTTAGAKIALRDDCLYGIKTAQLNRVSTVDSVEELKCGLSFPQER